MQQQTIPALVTNRAGQFRISSDRLAGIFFFADFVLIGQEASGSLDVGEAVSRRAAYQSEISCPTSDLPHTCPRAVYGFPVHYQVLVA